MNKALVIIELIRILSGHHDVNPEYMTCLARYESDYQVNAVSSAGAMGVFQIMPSTAHWWGDLSGLSDHVEEALPNINLAAWAVANGYAEHWSADRFCKHLGRP